MYLQENTLLRTAASSSATCCCISWPLNFLVPNEAPLLMRNTISVNLVKGPEVEKA